MPLPRIYNQGRQFYVTDYGAKGNGGADDTLAIQRAMNAAGVLGNVIFPPGTYRVTAPILLREKAVEVPQSLLRISGYGATLVTDQPIPIFKRIPVSEATSGAWAFLSFIFEGLKFKGSGLTGSKGIFLGKSRKTAVRDCSFYGLDVGLDLCFALQTDIRHCVAEACKTYCFAVRSGNGVWEGATDTPSNQTLLESCWAMGSAGQPALYYIHDSKAVALRECCAEGGTPVYGFDISVPYQEFVDMDNIWLEADVTGAYIRAVMTGHAYIRHMKISPSHQVTIVDASGSNANTTIVVSECPNLPTGCKFKHGTALETYKWRFEKLGISNANPDMTNVGNWVDGIVPANLVIEA